MHLLIITGFLGSGKTTLVIRLVKHALNHGIKTAILVNEIGEVGIDNQLMRQLDFNVWELLNGCICCTLSVDLVATLDKLNREYSPNLVILEPSGVADPKSILAMLPYYKAGNLDRVQTVTVLDPQRLEMLMEVLSPLLTSQVEPADIILVSKCDLASPQEKDYVHLIANQLKPGIKQIEIAPNIPLDDLFEELLHA